MEFPGLGEEFPEREEDIIALAWRMIEALEREPERYSNPPFSAAELREFVRQAQASRDACAAADQARREAYVAREHSVLALKESLKARLQYVELDVRGERVRLSGAGWGGRPGATDRELPGAVRDLAVGSQDDSTVMLEWRPPSNGGPAGEYRVQRRQPGGKWGYVATAVDNFCLLSNQPRGIELDYRVLAVNHAGSGEPSATVTVVL